VAAFLREKSGLGEEEALLRAGLAGGSLSGAAAFESQAYREAREALLSFLERAEEMGPVARMEAAETLDQADDTALLLTTLRSLLRDIAAARAGGAKAALVNSDVADRLAALGRGRLGDRAAALAERAGEARTALAGFANRLLTFDLLVDAVAAD
jgi:hypothetical protein